MTYDFDSTWRYLDHMNMKISWLIFCLFVRFAHSCKKLYDAHGKPFTCILDKDFLILEIHDLEDFLILMIYRILHEKESSWKNHDWIFRASSQDWTIHSQACVSYRMNFLSLDSFIQFLYKYHDSLQGRERTSVSERVSSVSRECNEWETYICELFDTLGPLG